MGPEETRLFNKLKEARERGVIGVHFSGSFDNMTKEQTAKSINDVYDHIKAGNAKQFDWNYDLESTLPNKITLNGNVYNLTWQPDKLKRFKYLVSCLPKESHGECWGFGDTPEETLTDLELSYIDLIDFMNDSTEG
jgi:hypothetical protein